MWDDHAFCVSLPPHEETVFQYFCCVSVCAYVCVCTEDLCTHRVSAVAIRHSLVFETGLLIEPRAPVCFGVAVQEAQRWILVSLPSQC